MQRLPVELVGQICSHLCLHCNVGQSFPHAETEGARASKLSLSRLSQTCKFLRAIAQPVVFHYYASGNMPMMFLSESDSPATYLATFRPRNDRLPLFVRSLLSRPDLASRVRALQLFPLPDTDSAAQNPDAVLQQATHSLGLNLDFQMSVMTNRHATFADLCLRHVVILLCPNLSTLLVAGDFFSSFGGSICKKSGRTLPLLRTVGIVPRSGSGNLAGVDKFLSACAPNVEALYVADLLHTHRPYYSVYTLDPKWDLTLRTIRRLVVHDLGPVGLSSLVRSCPLVCDLQYTHHGLWNRNSNGSLAECRQVVHAIQPLRKTLRRLSLVVMDGADPRGNLLDLPTIDSLRHFERLEKLAVNQAHIYPFSFTPSPSGRGLVDLLPRSIKELHFLYVFRDFGADMEVLAREAPKQLPNLGSVRVSLHSTGEDGDADPQDMSPFHADWGDVMDGLCKTAGISWAWEKGSPVGMRGLDPFPREIILSPSFVT